MNQFVLRPEFDSSWPIISGMFLPQPLFLCPQCRRPLPDRPPCTCGFVLRESEGVINLMTDEESAAVQSFVKAYNRVREDEKWGEDDLDLPFHPRRHGEIWAIRQRTFRKFQTLIASTPRGVALDIGAGNCWLTRYLDRWGFDSIAIDFNDSAADGLRAGKKFLDAGARFLRVRAGMERLPFAADRITLVTANASFHYASDFRAALSEFERVLTPGGMIVIIDSPFYADAADGERMTAERVLHFWQKYGIGETLASRSRYLTFNGFEEIARSMNMSWRMYSVWPGLARKYEEIRGILTGRSVAQFPVVVIEKPKD
jgi:ubiquinone/menaquinone biosynthesis C-methylase UbiE